MVNFINQFVQSNAFKSLLTVLDGFRITPVIVKTFFSLLVLSFVLYVIRRIFWG